MGFMSSLTRVQAALSTGGASLLAPRATQEQIGKGIFIGGGLAALGSGAAVLGAGGSLASAGSAAGSTGFSIGTFGTQLLGRAVPALMGMAGVGPGSPTAGAAPPGGAQPMDSMRRMPMPARNGFMGGGMMTAGMVPSGPVLMDDAGNIVSGPSGAFMPTAGAAGMIGRGLGGLAGGISRMAGNLVIAASGRIRGIMTQAGQFVSARRVMSGAKVLGLAGTAAGFGIAIDQLAAVVLQESTRRPRRSRGISAASMRTTRRTTRQIIRMHRDLSQLCGQAGFARRRRAAPIGARS